MKLVDETKSMEYKLKSFGDLELGVVFEDMAGGVYMKTRNLIYSGSDYNAIRLDDGSLRRLQYIDVVFPLNATMHFNKILEGDE